jgi:hypothetical protein
MGESVKIIALGQWYTSAFGNVTDGDVLEVDDFLGTQFIEQGYAMPYESENPVVKKPEDGQDSVAGSSLVAPLAPRRGRPRKYETKGE